MSKDFSYKLSNVNFLLVIFVVIIHSSCKRFINFSTNQLALVSYNFINTFLQVAVPLFFLISAYLLYRDLNKNNLKEKLSRRFKSLVLPYIIWNILFLIYYFIMNKIMISLGMESLNFDFSFNNIIPDLLWNGYFHTSWYIRNLIIYTMFSPFLMHILKSKKLSIFLNIILIIIQLVLKCGYSNPLYFFPIYFFGAILAYHNKENIENIRCKKRDILLAIPLLIVTFICSFYENNLAVMFFYRLFGSISFYIILSSINLIYKKPPKIAKISFLLMIIHVAIVQILTQLLIILFDITLLKSLIYPIITTSLTIEITKLIYIFLNRKLKNVLSILIGNRIK